MAVAWDPVRMATGVPQIDAQHREWLRRFNEFDHAVVNGTGTETVMQTLKFLVKYSETHFPSEERLAPPTLLRLAQLNESEHEHFRRMIRDFYYLLQKEGITQVELVSLKVDMEHWLSEHIIKVDRSLFASK